MFKRSKVANGRKYALALLAFVLILVGFSFTYWSPLFLKTYTEFVSGIVAIFLVYCGGNVSNKLVVKPPQVTEEEE